MTCEQQRKELIDFIRKLDVAWFLLEECVLVIKSLTQYKLWRLAENLADLQNTLEHMDKQHTLLLKQNLLSLPRPVLTSSIPNKAYYLSKKGKKHMKGRLRDLWHYCDAYPHQLCTLMHSIRGLFVLSLQEMMQARSTRRSLSQQLKEKKADHLPPS